MKQHTEELAYELASAAASLSQAINNLESAKDVKRFIEDLCTPAEIEAMVDRWRVAQSRQSLKRPIKIGKSVLLLLFILLQKSEEKSIAQFLRIHRSNFTH